MDDVLPALMRYTTVPCLSPDFDEGWEANGKLVEAATVMAQWAQARPVEGLDVRVIAQPGRTPLLLLDAPPTGSATGMVLVYGHLDKQPPLGAWRQGLGPFTPVLEGDRLYGRGTGDDGYALFCALTAVELLDRSRTPRPRVVVLIESSEESGSPDLPAHLDALQHVLSRPSLVVCLDSGCLSYDRLWLTSSLRGNLVATVSVQVLTEGVHSGSAGGIVPTSLRLLRVLLDRLEDPATGDIRLAALHSPRAHDTGGAQVASGVGAEELGASSGWRAVDVFPVVAGLQLDGASDQERLARRAWAPSMTVTGMDGIPAVRDGGNVLRPFSAAKISLRLPPNVSAPKAMKVVEAALLADPPSGARVEVRFDTPATGWTAPALEDWINDTLDGASLELFGHRFATLGEGGTIPFLSMLGDRWPGVPLVATGVLGPGSNAHGPNEFLHLPMAEAVTVATARLIAATGRRTPGAGTTR
jgi:acetylornithine deacetylase/succinyl-diaminopimelate desuccinylase-like protein